MANNKIQHIAIIMDGNGRWAEKRGLTRTEGHYAGSSNVKKIVKASIKYKVKYLSLYAFSTENWKRPKTEINILMKLLSRFIKKETEEFHRNNIRLLVSGDITVMPTGIRNEINRVIELTRNNTKFILNVCLNYGSRDEILNAVRSILKDFKKGKIKEERIDEKLFQKYLYNGELLPDPDLLIRTSGELRISNFLLWQIAYSEFYFTQTLWPDFNEQELGKAIEVYKKRNRRFGGL
ncbi:MAG: isoprenyl transferase [Spirochaetes bacterium]|nr:isoprenyl transferase [Spirochaetota bacterium]